MGLSCRLMFPKAAPICLTVCLHGEVRGGWAASASVNGATVSSWVDPPGMCLLKGRGLPLAEELRNTNSVEINLWLPG